MNITKVAIDKINNPSFRNKLFIQTNAEEYF
jgi:hypothetical protein